VRAPLAEAAGKDIGVVSQFLDDLLDMLACFWGDFLAVVDYARDGLRGNPRFPGHLGDGDLTVS